MEIITFAQAPADDVPTMMRKLADEIEADGETETMIAVEVRRDGSLEVYGWGDDPALPGAIGLLHMAISKLTNMADDDDE
ncbi:hypothetical protein BRX37_23995 [Sphingomonas sp. S-NIH.Pt3_0716]|nr:hypothetical protein BRX37_23995 [Sphingomonas sp. S-NIH.Pt3_0716]